MGVNMYDLFVIGGGPCGMSAAIAAAKRGKSVIIADKNPKLGRKLYATGNGRCNITNKQLDNVTNDNYLDLLKKFYNSNNSDYNEFLLQALGDNFYKEIIDFSNELGVIVRDLNGYVYPKSLQASSYVWSYMDYIKSLNIVVKTKYEVKNIIAKSDYYIIENENEQINAKNILFACGGKSYASLGGCENGYNLANKLNIKLEKVRPALCGLIVSKDTKDIAGIRISARAVLYDNEDNFIAEEEGELQLTDYGLSGIMIFNLSSVSGKLLEENKKPYIIVDFLKDDNLEDVLHNFKQNSYRTVLGKLNAYMNDKLALYILKELKLDPKLIASELSDEDIINIIKCLKNYKFEIKALKDFENAQVCAGGVALEELDYNFMSKSNKGMYFAGEVIDIDGICGGYNITFAILSGLKVGNNI